MGDYYNHKKHAWMKRELQVPLDLICFCWLSECNCQFQHHTDYFVLCDDPEIFQECINNKDINYGD